MWRGMKKFGSRTVAATNAIPDEDLANSGLEITVCGRRMPQTLFVHLERTPNHSYFDFLGRLLHAYL
jgi:hypothetical protein